jgi:hypothetical protein
VDLLWKYLFALFFWLDNWWHYFSLLKLSLHVIVVAEDNNTYTRYKNNINFTVVKGLSQSNGEKGTYTV